MESKEEELLDESNATNMQNSSSCQLIKATTEQLPQQISLKDVRKVSPAALAYLGDAVYELHMRMFYLLPPQRVESYHRLVVAQVRAETQAKILRSLTPYLRDTELEIVRRGRNASTKSPKRLEREIYQQATSLETLIGYLYLTDSQRLTELLQKLQLEKS